uniref:retinoblastoma-binding protein 5-like n=1 Tax=Ciona intestinalis TaxID=7719 RepID=UPI00006A66A5|nr:retinoblastoma-binding protein 5-like [Ciona intestinalis]|eukprot:XP_002129816.1 retinoblastoma-binding protein 5-like [Ciona intestinalis]
MNLELLESFGQNYPEEADGTLDTGSMAVTCTFNRHGTLLAVGCNDGRIVVWDFLTRGIAKVYNAHAHPVCSLSWSRNGRRLISAATDNLVCIWDVLSGECLHTYRFPTPIMKVQFAPRGGTVALVCPLRPAPVLLRVDSEHVTLPTLDELDSNIVATFDRRGDYIFTGNAKGRVAVIKTKSLKVVASFRVTTGTTNVAIKQIEFARKGTCFLVNTADRIIRVYDGKEVFMCGKNGEPEPIQKLQDLVNRTPWKKCCFSGDGEFICAGSAKQHQLYVWEKSVGNLVKILQGVRGEQLLDVVWHPIRPILCSISSGVVSVWAQNQVENWSAFAPDFSELDENVEYEEKETEFDEEDEDRSEDEEVKMTEEDQVEVDVTTVDPIRAFCSSDEDEQDPECLEFLPISPEIDEPEENVLLPPPDPTNQPTTSNEPSTKKQKVQNIKLNGTPGGEEHPLITGTKKPKKKNAGGRSRAGKPPKEAKQRTKVRQSRAGDDVLSMGTTIAGL